MTWHDEYYKNINCLNSSYVLPLITNPLVSKTLFYLMIKWYCEQWIRADSCIGESRDYMSRWSEEGGVSHTVPPFPPIHPLHCSTALYCTVLALRWSARLSKCSAPSWLTSPWAWWSPSSRVCQQVGQEVQADEYCPAAPAEWRLVSWVEVASLHSPLLSSQCRITWLATPRTSQTSHTLTLQHSAPEPEPELSLVTQFSGLASVHCSVS